ncbi:ECM331 [Candida pseudojiufengensis]|uniref:ECM331 n=1 Tax=Candida pseudojiufengensis TaxID=497109 RepID=UPI002224F1CE|nr:ECM331 [Candida pseudojiufengensis]KAI5968149.1 ECM331 [Candida pseudojiufengensis]
MKLFNSILLTGLISAIGINATTTTTSTTANTSTSTTSTSNNSCSFSSTTISALTAVEQVNSCPTLDGTILITGNEISEINLNSINQLNANLTIYNSSTINTINLNSIENITGSLNFNNLTQLRTINLNLIEMAQDLQFISLPNFENLNLNSDVLKAGRIILSNTALSNLNGLALFDSIEYININNNKNMSQLNFENLKNVSDSLILSFNHNNAQVNLNNLDWCSNLTIQDVSNFQANNLTFINGSLQFSYNSFDSLNVSSLTNIGSSLQIFANDELENLAFGSLTSIGGELRFFNNSELSQLNQTFTALQRIDGAVSINGNIDSFNLPNLQRIRGDFQLNSTSEDFNCDEFNDYHENGDIEGNNYICSYPSGSLIVTEGSTSSFSATDGSSETTSTDGNRSSGVEKLFIPNFAVVLVGICLGFLML